MKSAEGSRRKILVVDDLAELRELICDTVRDLGYAPVSADNGQAGLAVLEAEKPNAVICDIKMPLLNGLDFLKHIRAKGNEVPFIFMTGFADDVNMLEAIRLGAFHFLRKPFENSELQYVIERALDVGARVESISNSLSSIKERFPELAREIDVIERNRSQIERIKMAGSGHN